MSTATAFTRAWASRGSGPTMIQVAPDVLSFNEVNLGETGAQNFTITSLGETALEVADVHIAGGGSPFSVTMVDPELSFPLLLQQGETADAVVTYTRNAWGNHTGEAIQPAEVKADRS